jgi:predicted DNA-binding protein (MmcQ/YjbR family)
MIAFDRVRKLCLSLDDAEEKLSHGEPTFFVCRRVFVMFSTNHHGDGNCSIICNAPEGAQEILTKSDPENFYVPPYVGHAGWIGLRLNKSANWRTVWSIVKDAYEVTRAKAQRNRGRFSQRRRSGRTRA